MSVLETVLVELVVVLLVATTVGVALSRIANIPYTIALLLVGFGASVIGIPHTIGLTEEIILLVVLPALLFQGGANVDLQRLRENLLPVVLLAGPGLVLSILVLGVLGRYAFGYSLLFAAMIMPTDAVSVVAVFEDVGAPKQLSTVVESESLLNDGVGVAVFTTILAVVAEAFQRGISPAEFASAADLAWSIGFELLGASLGGFLVGVVAGYLVYRTMVVADDAMLGVTLTVVLAYGSYFLADALGASGAIAAVVAGLLIGDRGETEALDPQTRITVATTWGAVAFLLNTLLFVLIGLETPIDAFVDNAGLVLVAFVLVVLSRFVVVYPLVTVANRWLADPLSRSSQHVVGWSGLHASIPIALVLGLPADLPIALREELRVLVFGVAAFSLLVQGLTIAPLLERLGIGRRPPADAVYRLLTARLCGVDAALESASRLHRTEDLPTDLYVEFCETYGWEKRRLETAISQLLERYPSVRRRAELAGERRVLESEKEAVMEAIKSGVVEGEDADRLLETVDARLERVEAGESNVQRLEERGFREFWRDAIDAYDIDVDEPQLDGHEGRSNPDDE
ncbi:sodium:proton antiporter [Natronococcus pandeyae]|uniref:Sodium:proton antiporter n=1 Tax=Natronococcus pandeyae TaxID=2055836 RepID=A0A8J8TRP3_9EURY|nr:sodium:proton antiporter [Natronococcus pandeyae]TYL37929.1 sodium:proton antiporter [Natronococcus pandeyae]